MHQQSALGAIFELEMQRICVTGALLWTPLESLQFTLQCITARRPVLRSWGRLKTTSQIPTKYWHILFCGEHTETHTNQATEKRRNPQKPSQVGLLKNVFYNPALRCSPPLLGKSGHMPHNYGILTKVLTYGSTQ